MITSKIVPQLFTVSARGGESWADGDRAVACSVQGPEGPLEGSVAGAGTDYATTQPTVGDCVDEAGMPVDCTAEHFAEVYLITELTADQYPGDAGVEDEATDTCLTAFGDYVGITYEESALDFVFIAPNEETWGDGDRGLSCAVIDPSGSLTEPVRGSGL